MENYGTMAVYTFRVSLEDNENVYRDIEIKSVQKFSHLRDAILDAFKFDSKHLSSFFMSNDNWHKGKEITSDASKKKAMQAKDAVLKNYIEDPHQKIYFIYDFEKEWTFLIELQKINPTVDAKTSYPVCIKKTGAAPKQYKTVSKKVMEDDFDEDDEKLEKRFHEETFLYEEEEMEKDVETLDEGFEIIGEDGIQDISETPSSEMDDN